MTMRSKLTAAVFSGRSTKKVIFTVACTLAVVALISPPALASYRATLSASQLTTFTFTNNGANSGPAAATICFLVPKSKKQASGSDLVCYQLTAQVGTAVQLANADLTRTTRVIVDVDAPNGGGIVDLQVTQASGANFKDEFTADARLVYDVTP